MDRLAKASIYTSWRAVARGGRRQGELLLGRAVASAVASASESAAARAVTIVAALRLQRSQTRVMPRQRHPMDRRTGRPADCRCNQFQFVVYGSSHRHSLSERAQRGEGAAMTDGNEGRPIGEAFCRSCGSIPSISVGHSLRKSTKVRPKCKGGDMSS
jgi:hypothetical protein